MAGTSGWWGSGWQWKVTTEVWRVVDRKKLVGSDGCRLQSVSGRVSSDQIRSDHPQGTGVRCLPRYFTLVPTTVAGQVAQLSVLGPPCSAQTPPAPPSTVLLADIRLINGMNRRNRRGRLPNPTTVP